MQYCQLMSPSGNQPAGRLVAVPAGGRLFTTNSPPLPPLPLPRASPGTPPDSPLPTPRMSPGKRASRGSPSPRGGGRSPAKRRRTLSGRMRGSLGSPVVFVSSPLRSEKPQEMVVEAVTTPAVSAVSHRLRESLLSVAAQQKPQLSQEEEEAERVRKQLEKRKNAVSELIQTEASYVGFMATAVKELFRPMLEVNAIPLATGHEIVAALTDLVQFHEGLLQQLQEYQTSTSSHKNLGNIFINAEPLLRKHYSHYCKCYATWSETLRTLRRSDSKFIEFQNQALNSEKKLDVFSYIIMPVQRLPRYRLLLETIKASTPRTHTEYQSLVDASNAINTTNIVVNCHVGDDKRSVAVEVMLQRFMAATKSRHLNVVKTGDLVCQGTPISCVVLPEVALIGSKDDKGNVNLDFVFDLVVSFVKDVNPTSPVFYVATPQATVDLTAESAERKQEWVIVLEDTIRTLTLTNPTLKRRRDAAELVPLNETSWRVIDKGPQRRDSFSMPVDTPFASPMPMPMITSPSERRATPTPHQTPLRKLLGHAGRKKSFATPSTLSKPAN
eukprot:TRINITY_DN78_c1_g1_i5.p1 TRINITY_DN78_c1_g1~~TRINITY_DN78_c1_g1_i5.p1  ORF type:complete len:579 (+),score=139.76 TRINITY_DN78_c1_g1_i5:73-1737(+)